MYITDWDKKLTAAESVEFLQAHNSPAHIRALADARWDEIERLQAQIAELERQGEFLDKLFAEPVRFFGGIGIVVEERSKVAFFWPIGTDVPYLASIQKDDDDIFSVRFSDTRIQEIELLAEGCKTREEAEKVLEDKFVQVRRGL